MEMNASWPRRMLRLAVFSLQLSAVVGMPLGAWAQPTRLPAWVSEVEDGDTIKVALRDATAGNVTVRLTDIDAPEVGHGQSRPGQPHGRKSKAALSTMVLHQIVELECFADESYGRRICRVFMGGQDVGAKLVEMGLARAYRANSRYVRDKRIYDIEDLARAGQRGLWRDAKSMPPWEWRRLCWKEQFCPSGEDL